VISLTPNALGDTKQLTLSGTCDVRSASELQTLLCDLLREDSPVTIHCSAIDSIDTACMQLLVAAKREATKPLLFVIDEETEASKWFNLAGLHGFFDNDVSKQ
jgi:anti-anti-sigma regulatory factor